MTDVLAAQTKMDFALGWFADPIYLGRYPQSMIDRFGNRLPRFTEEEMQVVHGSSEVSLSAERR
jgi:beta-glucosidase